MHLIYILSLQKVTKGFVTLKLWIEIKHTRNTVLTDANTVLNNHGNNNLLRANFVSDLECV